MCCLPARLDWALRRDNYCRVSALAQGFNCRPWITVITPVVCRSLAESTQLPADPCGSVKERLVMVSLLVSGCLTPPRPQPKPCPTSTRLCITLGGRTASGALKKSQRSARVTSLEWSQHRSSCGPPCPLERFAGPPWSPCPVRLRSRRQCACQNFQTCVVRTAVETMLVRSTPACCRNRLRTWLKAARPVFALAARAPARETLAQADVGSWCPTWCRSAGPGRTTQAVAQPLGSLRCTLITRATAINHSVWFTMT